MNVNVTSRVYIKLAEFLFRCLKPDVNYSIAKVLIERINDFPDIAIEEIAYRANTSPASVTKFCKRLGYRSFKEMRTDLIYYGSADLALLGHSQQGMSPKAMTQQFLDNNRRIEETIFQAFDQEQCQQIAAFLTSTKKIAVFGSTHSTSVVNLFRELFSQEGIIVYELHRRSEEEIVMQVLKEVDAAFFISLSGDWVKQTTDLLSLDVKAKKYLLTNQPVPFFPELFQEVISFENIEFVFNSNYYSQKVIQSWIILLAIYLKTSS